MKYLLIILLYSCSVGQKIDQVETHTWVLSRIEQGFRDNVGTIYWLYWKDPNNSEHAELITYKERINYHLGQLWANKDKK